MKPHLGETSRVSHQLLQQVSQFTAAELTPARIEEWGRGGIAGVEFAFSDVIRDPHGVPALLAALDAFAQRDSDMPVLAAGVTCELRDVESLAAILSSVLAGCAARGVQHLNLSFVSAPTQGADGSGVDYGDVAHVVYTLLRDTRHNIEAVGLKVNLEAGTYGLFSSPLEMRQIVDAINSWAIGACVDFTPTSVLGRPADWISVLGSRLQAVRAHAHEAPYPDWKGLVIRTSAYIVV